MQQILQNSKDRVITLCKRGNYEDALNYLCFLVSRDVVDEDFESFEMLFDGWSKRDGITRADIFNRFLNRLKYLDPTFEPAAIL